jgi:hypothetical protein
MRTELEKVCSQLGNLKGDYSGLKIYEFNPNSKCPVNTTFALDHMTKATMKGSSLCFDVHINSYSYPVELVISAWSTQQPTVEMRAFNNGSYRMEAPVEIHKGLAMLEETVSSVRKLVWYLDHAKKDV